MRFIPGTIAVLWLLSACDAPSISKPHPDARVPPEGASLSSAQAVDIANAEALRNGVRLSEYRPPEARFQPEPKRERPVWVVFYEGRDDRPGHHFLVAIDDETKQPTIGWGE